MPNGSQFSKGMEKIKTNKAITLSFNIILDLIMLQFFYNRFHHPSVGVKFPFIEIQFFVPIAHTRFISFLRKAVTYFYNHRRAIGSKNKIQYTALGFHFFCYLKSQLYNFILKMFFFVKDITT